MIAKSRKILLLVFAFIMALSVSGIFCATAFANQSAPVVDDNIFQMQGASIRYDEPTGMRFSAQISPNVVEQVNGNESKTFGAFILPNDYLTANSITEITDHVTQFGKTVKYNDSQINYPEGLTAKLNAKTGYYEIEYSISTIKYGNYNREFYALAYIKTVSEGSATYEYADIIEGNNVRSVAEVAKIAYGNLNLDTDVEEELAQIESVENYIYKAEFLAKDGWNAQQATEKENNANGYVTAQKEAISEFVASVPTTATSSAVDSAYEKYNALGAFAKTVVESEKNAVDAKQIEIINNAIATVVSESETVEQADYYKIYGAKKNYEAIVAKNQLSAQEIATINKAQLDAVEETFNEKYIVVVIHGATEAEGKVGTDGNDHSIKKYYTNNDTYGPTMKLVNEGVQQRDNILYYQADGFKDYIGFNFYLNVYVSQPADLSLNQQNSAGEWKEIGKLTQSKWSNFEITYDDIEIDTRYNPNRWKLSVNLLAKNYYFLVSSLFAIRERDNNYNVYGDQLYSAFSTNTSDTFGATETITELSKGTEVTEDYIYDGSMGEKVVMVNAVKGTSGNASNWGVTFNFKPILIGLNAIENTVVKVNVWVNKQTIVGFGSYNINATSLTQGWNTLYFNKEQITNAIKGGLIAKDWAAPVTLLFSDFTLIKVTDIEQISATNLFSNGGTDTFSAIETISTATDQTYGNVVKIDITEGNNANTGVNRHWWVNVDYAKVLKMMELTGKDTVKFYIRYETSVTGRNADWIRLDGTTSDSSGNWIEIRNNGEWQEFTLTKQEIENFSNSAWTYTYAGGIPLTFYVTDFYLAD